MCCCSLHMVQFRLLSHLEFVLLLRVCFHSIPWLHSYRMCIVFIPTRKVNFPARFLARSFQLALCRWAVHSQRWACRAKSIHRNTSRLYYQQLKNYHIPLRHTHISLNGAPCSSRLNQRTAQCNYYLPVHPRQHKIILTRSILHSTRR